MTLFLSIGLPFLLVLAGCGSSGGTEKPAEDKVTKAPDPSTPTKTPESGSLEGTFDESLLSTFASWTPIFTEDIAFRSTGHGGILVRTYLNTAAKESADSTSPFPLKVGAIIAKAVVENSGISVSTAKRVYFMRKMAAGFDTKNADWAYGIANVVDGKLSFDKTLSTTSSGCVSCHAKVSQFDYVQTVDFYRTQKIP